MQFSRRAVSAVVLGVSLSVSSCGESPPVAPTAPPPTVQSGLLGGLLQTVSGLGALSCSPLPAASVTRTIGPSGGTINVGPHTLTIPAGALSRNVSITASIRPESVNRVRLQPSGLQFNRPASLTVSYANCSGLGILLPKVVAHVQHGGLGILDILSSIDNVLAKKVTGRLDHFSDYVVCWRSGSAHASEDESAFGVDDQ